MESVSFCPFRRLPISHINFSRRVGKMVTFWGDCRVTKSKSRAIMLLEILRKRLKSLLVMGSDLCVTKKGDIPSIYIDKMDLFLKELGLRVKSLNF